MGDKGAAFDERRLARLGKAMQWHVDEGGVPGIVAGLCRDGETHVVAVGRATLDGADPIRRDAIFRIASLTKPITAAAAMTLVEECRLRLDDPVDPLLPELADRRVLRTLASPLDDTVPANRPITLRDLLAFTAGYGAVMVWPPKYPIQEAMAAAGIEPGATLPDLTADELKARHGALPLAHQPGEGWLYNNGYDLLGVLLARATGRSLEAVLRERVLGPLGMVDTGFSVPSASVGRLPGCYWSPDGSEPPVPFDEPGKASRFARPPAYESGADGLVSTADDLLAFGRMILGQGEAAGVRVLSRASVAVMTTDQISPAVKAAGPFFPGFWERRGWGFGGVVVTRRDDLDGSPGRFGWDGGYGTSWYVDPAERLVGALMTQRLMTSPAAPAVFRDFWTSAYQALGD